MIAENFLLCKPFMHKIYSLKFTKKLKQLKLKKVLGQFLYTVFCQEKLDQMILNFPSHLLFHD